MIPILFESNATNFKTNGIGALTGVIDCFVEEERNGAFTLEMTIATTTPHFEHIKVGNLIVAQPFLNGTRQAFEIVDITKPLNQKVVVRANHLSYRASYVPIAPFTANGITETLERMSSNALIENNFVLYSDIDNPTSTYIQNVPKSLRACLGGTQGSLLDVFSGGGTGEFLWDNYTINFLAHRGSDNGVSLRYRKNITDFEHDETIEELITGVLPMWANEDSSVVFYGDIQFAPNYQAYDVQRIVVLDLSGEVQNPTNEMLNQMGEEYITKTSLNLPKTNIKLSFVDLSKTSEQAILENINLCDTIHIVYSPLNIQFTSKVVKTRWDVLKERYDSIEIGSPSSNIAKTLATNFGDISSLITTGKTLVSITQSIDRNLGEVQTSISEINGTLGQHTTQISQNAQEIVLRATQSDFDQLEEQVRTQGTALIVGLNDVRVQQSDDGYLSLEGNKLNIVADNNVVASFSETGTDTRKLSIDERWHQDTLNTGATWILYYKEDELNGN